LAVFGRSSDDFSTNSAEGGEEVIKERRKE
jgi:hypothetical protein